MISSLGEFCSNAFHLPSSSTPCNYMGEVYAHMREMNENRKLISSDEIVCFRFVYDQQISKRLYISKRENVEKVLQSLVVGPYINYSFVYKTNIFSKILKEKELKMKFGELMKENVTSNDNIIKAYNKMKLTPELENDMNSPETNTKNYKLFESESGKLSQYYTFYFFKYQRLLIDIETQYSENDFNNL